MSQTILKTCIIYGMRRFNLPAFLLFFSLPAALFSAEHKAAGDLFAIDFESGWTEAKSNDPAAVMRLEKGKGFFEITKLEDELTDYYLKARVKEQAENLKQKGSSPSEVKSASIHSVSSAYYITYSQDSETNIISFFTYQGVSYSFISKSVGEAAFKDLAYFFRKPGEKIEVKKPKPAPKKKKTVKKEQRDTTFDEFLSTSTTGAFLVAVETGKDDFSSSTGAAGTVLVDDGSKQMDEARDQAKKWLSDVAARTSGAAGESYIKRAPLNRYLAAVLAAFWIVFSFVFRKIGAGIPNPKMTPYPQEVPPDFFFPFIITRVSTFRETMFQIITRQRQILSGYYNHESSPFLFFGVFGIFYLHLVWSFSDFVSPGLVSGIMLSLPLGKFVASVPELPFLFLLAWGAFKKMKSVEKLVIQDSQTNLVMEVGKGKDCYAVLRDGKGKDVARLHKRGTAMERQWHFSDLDNQVAFTIIDEHPKLFIASKFLGVQGGGLRSRYGIFVDGKRAGFLFVDSHSAEGFQIHLEFGYERVAHQAQILAALLYIISREKERSFLSL